MKATSDHPRAGLFEVEIAYWFLLGGLVTAPFSLSLYAHAANASFRGVAITGMLVPCFTWVVQLSLAAFGMPSAKGQPYAKDLGRVCFWGSVALLPGALVNALQLPYGLWMSVINVVGSVIFMAWYLFRLTKQQDISPLWPISWCFTIALNMALFVMFSWHWWQT